MRSFIAGLLRTQCYVFDPRKGEDFRLTLRAAGSGTFSSLSHNCTVLHIIRKRWILVGRVPETLMDPELILRVISATGAMVFTSIVPGHALRSPPTVADKRLLWHGGGWFGEFPVQRGIVLDFMKLMKESADYEEWTIGACVSPLLDAGELGSRLRQGCPELDAFLVRFDNVRSIWYFNHDCGEMMAFFAPFEGREEVLRRLRALATC